jgi:hypothetical protein
MILASFDDFLLSVITERITFFNVSINFVLINPLCVNKLSPLTRAWDLKNRIRFFCEADRLEVANPNMVAIPKFFSTMYMNAQMLPAS